MINSIKFLKNGKGHLGDFLAYSLFFLALAGWTWFILLKYLRFEYWDWDLAFFSQATWNIMHGSQYSSLFYVNFFGNHANLIVYLILPFYAIFSHPLTLVFLKIASYLTGALILYHLAKEKLTAIPAVIIMLCYITYPPNLHAMNYEFDFETLSPLFLFLLYYFFVKNKFWPFLITSLTTILIKENMPLIIIAFGIYALFSKKKDKLRWAVIPFLLGAIGLYFLTAIFIPSMTNSTSYYYLTNYHDLGNTPFEILFTLITQPAKISILLFSAQKLHLLFEMFGSLLYFPFLSPHTLFLMSPILLQHLLSSVPQEHTIFYQYTASIAPFVFLALVNSFALIRVKTKPLIYRSCITVVTILCALNFFIHAENIARRKPLCDERLNAARWEMVNLVPKDAAVIASFNFLPELSNRKFLYAFYKIYSDHYQRPQNPFRLPDHVTYAVLDFNDPWLQGEHDNNPGIVQSRIDNFLLGNRWLVLKKSESLILLKRNTGEKHD